MNYQIQQPKEVCQKQGAENPDHRPQSPEKATSATVSVEQVLVCSIFLSFNMWDITTHDVIVLLLCKEKILIQCRLLIT